MEYFESIKPEDNGQIVTDGLTLDQHWKREIAFACSRYEDFVPIVGILKLHEKEYDQGVSFFECALQKTTTMNLSPYEIMFLSLAFVNDRIEKGKL